MPTKKVFYDGNCPLCNKEINLYKKLDTEAKFDWIDINTNQKLLDEYNLSFIDTMKIFHVIDNTGTVQKGVDGFLVIWRELKYWKILYFIVRLPLIKQLARIVYHWFAIWRFKKNCNCD
jgi:predicted DCC family thiol-disulfide oxidoreductase YuxK